MRHLPLEGLVGRGKMLNVAASPDGQLVLRYCCCALERRRRGNVVWMYRVRLLQHRRMVAGKGMRVGRNVPHWRANAGRWCVHVRWRPCTLVPVDCSAAGSHEAIDPSAWTQRFFHVAVSTNATVEVVTLVESRLSRSHDDSAPRRLLWLDGGWPAGPVQIRAPALAGYSNMRRLSPGLGPSLVWLGPCVDAVCSASKSNKCRKSKVF